MSNMEGADKLRAYLRTIRDAMQAASTVHCVVGNESADLDSMASAVMHAYSRGSTNAQNDAAFVPLINIPRADFKLRTEAVFLFNEAGVEPDLLLFADEVDLAKLHSEGRLKLSLVDHNKPAAAHSKFESAVAEIVDHHADEGLYHDAALRVIEPVGSTATLVAEAILDGHEDLLDEGATKLLLGTILLDTVNLDPEAKRVTPKDERVAAKLLALSGVDQQELFDAVQSEKFNVSALDTADLLRKDYKEWQMGEYRIGISSVLLSVGDWLKKDPALSGALTTYAEARNLDLLLAMNAYAAPKFTRELVVYCPDQSLREKVLQFLEQSELQLQPIDAGDIDESTALYFQGNPAISRKKLQPMLAEFLVKL